MNAHPKTAALTDTIYAKPPSSETAHRLVAAANSLLQHFETGKPIDAKSIMGLLMLGAAKGSSVVFQVEGNDEAAAMDELTDLFARRFDEEE